MKMLILAFVLLAPIDALSSKFIIANNTRLTYDYGSDVKPYIANEVKFTNDISGTVFSANKLRLGFRYKINDNVRIDPHVFMDNKLEDSWAFAFGPALRLDITY